MDKLLTVNFAAPDEESPGDRNDTILNNPSNMDHETKVHLKKALSSFFVKASYEEIQRRFHDQCKA